MRHKYYRVTKKGSKKPIIGGWSGGPYYDGKWAQKMKRIYVEYDYAWQGAWEMFLECCSMDHYKDVELWLGKDLIAEAYRNPRPKDEYDIYRIRVTAKACKELRDYIAQKTNAGYNFLPSY
jgi:hypothetical protein